MTGTNIRVEYYNHGKITPWIGTQSSPVHIYSCCGVQIRTRYLTVVRLYRCAYYSRGESQEGERPSHRSKLKINAEEELGHREGKML